MQLQREAMTDSLADVIHIIHLGGKSGILTAERGEGRTIEEGFIAFIDGRVVKAMVGRQGGLAAFIYLISWQMCRFSFISEAVHDAPASPPPTQFSPSVDLHYVLPDTTSLVDALYDDKILIESQNHGSIEYHNR